MIANPTTNVQRVTAGLVAGAVVGALGTVVLTLVVALFHTSEAGGFRNQDIPFALFMLAAAFVIWAIGLAVVGTPIWWLFHRKGWRDRWIAAIVGAAATFIVNLGLEAGSNLLMQLENSSRYSGGDSGGMTVVNDQLTAHGWWSAIQDSLLLAGVGAVVALVIWQIAYRPGRAT